MLYIKPNTGIESRKYLCTKSLSALPLQGTFLIWSHSVPLREAAHSTGTALGRPALCWRHLSLPPPLLLSQSMHHVPSQWRALTALTYLWGAFLLEYGKQPNQNAVQCRALSRMNIPCRANVQALLTVMFPARKNSHFPVSAIWHRVCIDLLTDLTKGITWNACGRCVNEDSPPCAYSLNFNGNEPDNWCQSTAQCKRTKYKGRFSLFLNISNTAQKKKKVVLKWQKTGTQSLFDLTVIYRP